jgi:hypothetical protein
MIGTAYGLRRPRFHSGEETLVMANSVPKPRNTSDFIGVEIEIEGCEPDHGMASRRMLAAHLSSPSTLAGVWQVKRDGSLRNNGLEYVTVPIHASSLEFILTQLYAYLRQSYPTCDFSDRCGIHIHTDCTGMSAQNLLDFLKLYIIFENPIFNFIGEERKGSNFCVPLHNFQPSRWFDHTQLSNERILHNIPSLDQAKYSALNPCRLVDLGTLEFRHLEGTWDVQRVVTFASIIQRMKYYAMSSGNSQRIEEFITTANTISNFDQFTREVFSPQYFEHIIPNEYDLKEIEAGVSQAKKFLMGLQGDNYIPSAMIMDVFGNEVAAKRLRKFMERKSAPRTPARPEVAREDDMLSRELVDDGPHNEDEEVVEEPNRDPVPRRVPRARPATPTPNPVWQGFAVAPGPGLFTMDDFGVTTITTTTTGEGEQR